MLDDYFCGLCVDGLVDYLEVPCLGVFDAGSCVAVEVSDVVKLVYGCVSECLREVFREVRYASADMASMSVRDFLAKYRDR